MGGVTEDDLDREALLYAPPRRRAGPPFSSSHCSRPIYRGAALISILSGLLLAATSVSHLRFSTPRWAPPFHSKSVPGRKVVREGVAIAAACRNRHSALKQVLPTWLALKGLSEIIIVDWSSSPPLSEVLQEYSSNPKVRLVRIDAEPTWILSRALNMAISLTQHAIVAKMDCDYVVTNERPDGFLLHHKISSSSNYFYTGNYMNARSDNEVHLNGALIVRRDHFMSVGGYDERIQRYGYDDEDLYDRLESRGIERRNVSFDYISHLQHRNSARAQNGVHFPRVQIDFNKQMVNACPTKWSQSMRKSEYKRRNGTEIEEYIATFIPQPITNWVNATFRREQWRIALAARLNRDFSLPWVMISSMSTTSMEVLLGNLMRREAKLDSDDASKDHAMPRIFFVHTQNGLGNRLRALGSAMDFANKTTRELVIIWEKDEHLQAPISSVLNVSRLPYVVMNSAQFRWPVLGWRKYDQAWWDIDAYNYMLDEGKDVKIVNNQSQHIYFKSAFAMVSDYTSWETENWHLRNLPIREDILDLVDQTTKAHPIDFGGAHIRNRSLAEDIKNLKDVEDEYSAEDIKELNKWRNLTSFRAFVPEMRLLLQQNVSKFFVASDTVGVFPKLKEQLGENKIFYIHRSCDDRSADCIKYAMADILVLAKSKIFLGSTWSSFSEAAMRFGGPKALLAGTDFAQPPKWVSAAAAKT